MLKLCYTTVILFFVALHVQGQQGWISGYLRDSTTHFPIANGIISNSSGNKKVQTDAKGFFRIKAAPNDLLYAVAPSYHYDTIRYSILFGDTLTVYLAPVGNVLANVTVRSQYSRYQVDSIERRSAFEQMRGQTLNAVSSDRTSGFGVILNLDRFTKKKYRNKKKEEALFEKNEQLAYTNYRYSPQLVAMYTGLKGDSLRIFMYRFTPDYEWLRAHPSNEEVIYYINDKLKEYRKTPYKQP